MKKGHLRFPYNSEKVKVSMVQSAPHLNMPSILGFNKVLSSDNQYENFTMDSKSHEFV